MKKKILIISHYYYPFSSGTITCLQNVLSKMTDQYDFILYSAKLSKEAVRQEEYLGITVKRLSGFCDGIVEFKEKCRKRAQTLFGNASINRVLVFMIKTVFFSFSQLCRWFGCYYMSGWKRNAPKMIFKNEKLEEYAGIIAIGEPFEDVKIAVELHEKYSNLKLILIHFDLYTYNPVYLNRDKRKDQFAVRMREEFRWLENANYVIVTEEMKKAMLQSRLRVWERKMVQLFIPSLDKIVAEESDYLSDVDHKIKIVYTGQFYEDIRNPRYMLDILQKVCAINEKISVHIIGSGCESIVEEYRIKSNNKIIVYGNRSKEFTVEKMQGAEILLNVSNSIVTQTPSKILEYIGTCKPILNFISVKNDICEGLLEDYPLSLTIFQEENKKEKHVQEVEEFISRMAGKLCDERLVAERYEKYTAKHFASKLQELIEEDNCD